MQLPRILRIPREPDFVIGAKDDPYLRRWWVIPRNRIFNIYLHQILKDDDDRALHCHPWFSCSIILKGGYLEYRNDGVFLRKKGSITFRRASTAHRLVLRLQGDYNRIPCWSLFITGPKVREWGFHCKKGWMHWREFIGVPEGEARGDEDNKGCGD